MHSSFTGLDCGIIIAAVCLAATLDSCYFQQLILACNIPIGKDIKLDAVDRQFGPHRTPSCVCMVVLSWTVVVWLEILFQNSSG